VGMCVIVGMLVGIHVVIGAIVGGCLLVQACNAHNNCVPLYDSLTALCYTCYRQNELDNSD